MIVEILLRLLKPLTAMLQEASFLAEAQSALMASTATLVVMLTRGSMELMFAVALQDFLTLLAAVLSGNGREDSVGRDGVDGSRCREAGNAHDDVGGQRVPRSDACGCPLSHALVVLVCRGAAPGNTCIALLPRRRYAASLPRFIVCGLASW